MYTILVDGKLLYHPLLANEGYAISDGSVSLELDKTGSAEFTIPGSNPSYSLCHRMKSMIQIMRDDNEIFRGRILHDEQDFNNNLNIYCEGELAFMIDNIRSPYTYTDTIENIFKRYIATYNEQVEAIKRFTVGIVTVSAPEGNITVSSNEYPNIWDEINKKLVEPYGGHLRIRIENGIRYIDYVSEFNHTSNQVIQFGENLLDITKYMSAEDAVTVLIPLGKDEGNENGRVNITTVNDGHLHLADPIAQSTFGNIWRTQVWDEVTDPATLKRLGQEYLKQNSFGITTFTVSAADLSLINKDYETFTIGDSVRVISLPHGINMEMQCTKITINLLKPESSELTFGHAGKDMTSQTTHTGVLVNDIASDLAIEQSIRETLATIVEDSNTLANQANSNASAANANATAAKSSVDDLTRRADSGEFDGASAFTIIVTSSRGNMLIDRGANTTLTARAFYGGVEVTDSVSAWQWTKTDSEGNPDVEWNRNAGTGNTIQIGPQDVFRNAVFTCRATYNA